MDNNKEWLIVNCAQLRLIGGNDNKQKLNGHVWSSLVEHVGQQTKIMFVHTNYSE